jgi:hypothetical protein
MSNSALNIRIVYPNIQGILSGSDLNIRSATPNIQVIFFLSHGLKLKVSAENTVEIAQALDF